MKQKIGKVKTFLFNLTESLQEYLPNDWENEGLPNLRMLKRYSWGHGGIGIKTTVAGFPSCNVYMNYGISHNCLTPILDKITMANGWKPIHGVNQFGTDTRNRKLNPKFSTIFIEDYNVCNYDRVVSELMEDSLDKLLDYFTKFSELINIRDALVNRDKNLFGTCAGEKVTAIDFVLKDFEHLRYFRENIAYDYEIIQIDKAAEVLGINLY